MQIIAKDLTFTYNKKTKFKTVALDGISLEINEGDFFGIIGHTGSGKSTFIQHLNALIPIESGTLTVGDIVLSSGKKTDKKKLRELRAKIGMVFQYPEYQLFATTVYEDIAFGYKNFYPKATEEEVKMAVYSSIKAVGLSDSIANKSPFELSGGQKRRVAIAGVIVSKPEVLVLDEPVAGLDPVGKRELMALLHELHKSYCKTIIIVSHDMDEVAENCTRAAVFSNGKVVMVGTVSEIFSRGDELESLRLGVPITGYVAKRLKDCGIEISCNFTQDDFIQKIVEYYGKK